MRAGIDAACRDGVVAITAGNYGGKLGPHHFHLRKIMGGRRERRPRRQPASADPAAARTSARCSRELERALAPPSSLAGRSVLEGEARVPLGDLFDRDAERPSGLIRFEGDLAAPIASAPGWPKARSWSRAASGTRRGSGCRAACSTSTAMRATGPAARSPRRAGG